MASFTVSGRSGQASSSTRSHSSSANNASYSASRCFETGLFPGKSSDSSAPLEGTFTDGKLHHFAGGRSFSHEGPFLTGRRRVVRSCASRCGWLLRRIMRYFFARMRNQRVGLRVALVVLLSLVIEGVAE